MSLNGFVYKGICNLIREYNPVPVLYWSKYDGMRCIPLIELYSTTYYDVESVGWVSIFSFRVFPLCLGIPSSLALGPYEFRFTKMS